MRRIITALLVLLTTSAIAQNGGQITGKKNSGLTGTVMVDSVALKVSDSASRVYLSAMKLKSDSIYKRMYQDSVNLAKLGTGVTITGNVNTTISDVTKKTLSTQLVSADTGLVVNAVMHGLATGGGGGYKDVKVNPSGALTVDATQSGTWNVNNTPSASDSTKYRSTIQVSNFPASQTVTFTRLKASTDTLIANLDATDSTNIAGINSKLAGTLTVGSHAVTNAGTFAVQATQSGTWNVNNVSGTISLPTGASTETTLSDLNSKVPSGLTTAGSRLAIYSPDSIKVFATNGFGSGGSGGTTSVDAVDSTNLANTSTNTSNTNSKLPSGLTVTSTRLLVDGSGVTQPVSFTRLKASTDTVAISGSITATAGATAIYDSTYTAVQMDTAGLGAMANSATVGWQSDSVGLRQHKCTDVKIGVKISMANTAPANDKAVYVYVYPMWYDGSTWYFTSGGTATFPSGANSTYTIASPNNLRLLGVLSYTTTNMVLQDQFVLSNAFGSTMPDAFGLVIVDFSGAAIHTTNHRIYYSLINKVQR